MDVSTDPLPNALTVDVEDWYQVSAFEDVIQREHWDRYDDRVVRNTTLLLDLFRRHDALGTFFVLGWVAERHPDLVRRIHDDGHEVASHGYEHRLVTSMTPETFRTDLARAKRALEAAAPVRVEGFRAPSFSVGTENLWAHDVLREEGYTFSSSIFPVRHDRYGIPDFPRHPVPLEDDAGRVLWEFPMTTWRVVGRNLPAAGGGWMRLFPAPLTEHAIRRANAEGIPANVYVHPWEFDPDQPEVEGIGGRTRWRHRVGLGRMEGRLARLLERFAFAPVSAVLEAFAEARSEPATPRR